ncbi:amidohydrolase family protein [Ruegeria sp. 2012CJ41-6]|uniref:imidazolonepropionase n=1 Tax=Ruegeria spongiae TaxID=2942209 RepID=A0ABT0Q845_9RHOB|nr:amidohydrolase family protein [Ruegeria spongiae]MCL6285967.1 amidohydrolase family protein [Ruegeria spongiae]
MSKRLVLSNLSVITMAGENPDTEVIENALIVSEDGVVAFVGPEDEFEGDNSGAIDMEGALCLPGLVVCHNPCLWAGDVPSERPISSEGYRHLTRQVTEATSAADESHLIALLADRIGSLARSGVTSCELKSGYGGDADTELRLVCTLATFAKTSAMRTRITLALGHSFTGDGDPDEFLEHIERVIVPATYEDDLTDAVEVFCDDEAALDLDVCSTILELYYKKKTPSRVACDRFEDSAGATLPASFYSRCAIFLNKTEDLDLEILCNVGTVTVVVPDTMDMDEGQTAPDISAIREAGGRIAISPNLGPDGSGSASILDAMRKSRKQLDLTLEETIAAATVNAARALGLSDEAGIIAAGRPADFALFNAKSLEALIDEHGSACVATTLSGNLARY